MAEIEIPEIENIDVGLLKVDGKNPNRMDKAQRAALKKNIIRFGFVVPIITNKDLLIADGENRWEIGIELGMKKVPVIRLNVSEVDRRMLRQILNKLRGEHLPGLDIQEFKYFLDNKALAGLAELMAKEEAEFLAIIKKANFDDKYQGTKLKDDFIFPPFSILNGRSAEWHERKKTWYSLIDAPAKTREGLLAKKSGIMTSINNGTSLFDPVLIEVMLAWFCPRGGTVFDPFAGDVEPGVVALHKGYKFKGIELRQAQVDSNSEVFKKIQGEFELFCNDAINLDAHVQEETMDFLITCPPYYDLEEYSKLPEDLSNMNVEEFDAKYKQIIHKAAKTLKQNSFACFVVGEVREKNGVYRNLVPKTIQYAQEAGLQYYNELILVNQLGTLPLRARKPFEKSRKVRKTHQNILVFFKGQGPENWVGEKFAK